MSTLADSYQLLAQAHAENDTASVAQALADSVEPGAVLVLSGGLGAGKTTLIKHLADHLGINPSEVRSPSFTLVHEYRTGRLPVVHMDVYRLPNATEFEAIGGFEYLAANEGLVAIEWGEQIADELDPDWLQLRIDMNPSNGTRRFWSRSTGRESAAWLGRILKRLGGEGRA